MRECLKRNNAEYCNGDTPREHNVLIFFPYNTEKKFVNLSGNQLSINFKRLTGLKITVVKFTYLKG